MKSFFEGLPKGYCGICEVCGKWGHTHAHPTLPTTGAWCDEHYQALCSGKHFNVIDIIAPLFIVIMVSIIIYQIIMLF